MYNCVFCGSPDCSNDCRIDYDNEDSTEIQEQEDYLNALLQDARMLEDALKNTGELNEGSV